MKKASVLYLDDEFNNLISFRANFRQHYNVFIAQNAQEAMEILLSQDISVAVADQRMPDKTGVEFFEEALTQKPEVIRILLTGYSDINAVVDAINKGQVYRYLTKPWNREELKVTIDNAVDLYQTRSALREKEESLDKARNELDKFVYSVSHDLRSPLMSILGVVDLAENEIKDSTDSSLEYFRLIKELVNRLDGFILQVIDYYKGTHNFDDVVAVQMGETLDQVFENFKYHPLAKGVKINKKVIQNGDFYTSPIKLNVILNNLVSNAFKYKRDEDGNQPEVNVSISVNAEKSVIEVTDNGQGIPRDKLKHVFDMFFRASRKNSGSGIGLYIVKEAIQRLNGSIEVNSQEGQGTTFIVTLPVLQKNQEKI